MSPSVSAFRATVLQNRAIAAMMSVVARVIAPVYIILSLPCGAQKRHNPSREVLGDHRRTISAKPVGVGAALQRLIPTGKQSSLPMRTVTTERDSSSAPTKD
jgi:hypothetical protein